MKLLKFMYAALLLGLLPKLANADWVKFGSTTEFGFTIMKIQFVPASGTGTGLVKFWTNEYNSTNPNVNFFYTFSSGDGITFDQAKMILSILMTAQSSGAKVQVAIPGAGTDFSNGLINGDNIISTIRLVN